MSAVNKLLDKTREACSISTDIGLAEKLGVSRQLVNQWRKGANPMSDERIAQIAGIAGEDVSTWLVLVRAEQTHGDAGRAWAKLARQLGAAAALAIVGLFVALPGQANASTGETLTGAPVMHYAKLWRRLHARLRAAFRKALARWDAAWRLHDAPALLA